MRHAGPFGRRAAPHATAARPTTPTRCDLDLDLISGPCFGLSKAAFLTCSYFKLTKLPFVGRKMTRFLIPGEVGGPFHGSQQVRP